MKEAARKPAARTSAKTNAKASTAKRSGTRKTSGKAAAKKKDDIFGGEILGLALTGTGIFIGVTLFSGNSGVLGKTIGEAVFAAFGITAYTVPFLFLLSGVSLILRRPGIFSNKRTYGAMLLLATVAMIMSLNRMESIHSSGFFATMKNLLNIEDRNHGGILGLVFATPLYRLIGPVGAYIVAGCLAILSGVLIFNTTVYDSLKKGNQVRLATKDMMMKRTLNKEVKGAGKLEEEKRIEEKMKILDIMKKGEEPKAEVISEVKPDLIQPDPERFQKSPFINVLEEKIQKEEARAEEKKPEIIIQTAPVEVVLHEEHEEIEEDLEDLVPLKGQQIDIDIESVGIKEKPKPRYHYPEIGLLKENIKGMLEREDMTEIRDNARKLEETLMSFGVEAHVINVSKGPSVTRYELQPKAGVKVSRIVSLSDDIALGLAASGVRIEAPIPGKAAVGIEIPNRETTPVYLREVIESKEFQKSTKKIAVALGKDISGESIIGDLTKMPHVLIAGATGSGKSVCINSLIISILYKYNPDEVRLLMVDPKVVELNVYNGIPHLLIPVVTDPKKAAGALNWAVNEMTRRYQSFAEYGVRNIESHNELAKKKKEIAKLPYIVVVVDELADLMMVSANEVEDYIARLAQMARAAGMHLVIATQRPSVDVITGVIKANIPSRISFAVSSSIDSRTILDSGGAEKLLGKGDMLYYPVGEQKPKRVQGAFISEEEVEAIVARIKVPDSELSYSEEIINHIEKGREDGESEEDGDELFDEAVKVVVEYQQASTSFLQRRMRIGYNRAARIMDQLEERGVISGKDGAKPRQILYKNTDI
ncbi:FtsK/SpoIIIE family DNA translocase [Youngiibacter fragilis]|uniref:Cell division protein FtsK n=1 Tax=Youngiibacter fragilis 232.1 TaxID=994573 RepID=V7I9K3_9CLOT|nr:DNA translocase FtsK [Youngiibacter fragilis]ETA81971.1 cell division protein FtsK [Youngiibacter fragilis 232.1]